MGRGRLFRVSTAAAGLIAAPLLVANAQESGIEMTLDLNESVRVSDNLEFDDTPAGTSVISQTSLTFGLSASTSVEQFSLRAGGLFQAGYFANEGGFSSNFNSPYVGLRYARQVSSTAFTVDADYRSRDVSTYFFDPDFSGDDLTVDSGQITTYSLGASVETGIDAPFGISAKARTSWNEYNNTTDPSLVDNDRNSIDVRARFQITPTVELAALGGYSVYRADGATNRRLTRGYIGAGAVVEVSPVLRFSADITSHEMLDSQTFGFIRTTSKSAGMSYDFGAELDRPNGKYTASVISSAETTGRRTTAMVGRDFEYQTGAMSLSFGVTDSALTDPLPVVVLSYTQELPRAALRAQITQRATTNEDYVESLNTSISFSYLQELNSVSGLDTSLTLADYNALSAGGTDSQRLQLSVAYRHELTSKWDLRAGYEFTHARQDGVTDRSANTLFVGINRRFNLKN